MGLDFTWKGKTDNEETARWAYSGFNRFREKIAEELGMDLEQFWGDKKPKDDIVPLLDHSDCDGELTVEQCKKVAPRLRELVRDWEEGYDKEMAILLANNMESAALEETPLIFT